ncbi:MAG: PhoU domain-containing protein [Pseudomonadota bacterium]
MSSSFFGLLKDHSLLEASQRQALEMLRTTHEMFRIAVRALMEESSPPVKDKLRLLDQQVNQGQQEVRRKVFEALALSQGKNLLTGLRLLNIVIDLERIGDYTKNMAELDAMFPKSLSFHEYTEIVDDILAKTGQLFDVTHRVIETGERAEAERGLALYQQVAALCDRKLEKLVAADTGEDTVPRWQMALVLLLRYDKRVAAHLKNVCSAEINPFHRIGFRP